MKAKDAALSEAARFGEQKGTALHMVREKESAFPVGNPWGNTD